MLNKKLMMLTIILISLFAFSAVSTADNATDDAVGMEDAMDEVAMHHIAKLFLFFKIQQPVSEIQT